MNRDLQAPEHAPKASLSLEHDRLIELLEHLREVVLVKNDLPAIRSALDELDEYGRWEFGLEESAFDHRRAENLIQSMSCSSKSCGTCDAASMAAWSASRIVTVQICTIVSRTGWCMH